MKIDGEYFVPDKHKVRLEDYTKYEYIFQGKHELAFAPSIPEGAMYIPELFGQLISFTSADLLFGLEPVSITSNDDAGQDFIDNFRVSNPQLDTLLFESALTCSYMGDVVAELKLVEGEPKVMFHDPRHWVPVIGADGEVSQHELCFVIKDSRGNRYVRKRIHKKGLIINELWKVKNNDKTKKSFDYDDLERADFADIGMEVEEEQETEVDGFLVKQVPNMRILNSVFGMTDYIGKEQLMNSLNMLGSFATFVLEKNSDPAMEVPEGTVDEDSEVYRHDLRLFQTNAQTKGTPRFVTWDGNLESLFKQRTNVIESLAMYSEISLGLLGKETGGSMPEAYRTARLKYMRTLMKMARKHRYWKEAIMWMLETAQELSGAREISDFNVQFSDGLPNDYIENLEQKQLERDLKIKSNETIIRETLEEQGWTQEQVNEEIERIRTEKADAQQILGGTAPVNIFERQTEVTTTNDGKQDQANNRG